MSVRARVVKGRLRVDEPTALPDGTELDLVVDDEGDSLDARERAALAEHLSRAWAHVQAGRVSPASVILGELRRRR